MTSALLPPGAAAVEVHCQCCGRRLTDRTSIAEQIGPDCLMKLRGRTGRRHTRAGQPGTGQSPLPLEGLAVVEAPALDVSVWPWWIVSGVCVCGRGRCGVTLLNVPGPWTTAQVEAAAREHAPSCEA